MRDRGHIGTAVAILLAATVIGTAGGPAGAAEPPVTVTVTPGTGLRDGHPVTVTATGLEPGGFYVVRECAGSDCQQFLSPPPAVFVAPDTTFATAGDDGNLVASLQLDRDPDYAGEAHDCALDPCTVQVARLVGDVVVEHHSAVLGFEPTGAYQWPRASIALARVTGLVERQLVEVSGSGFDPWWGGVHYRIWATAAVEVCRAVPNPSAADCTVPRPSLQTYGDGVTGVPGGDVASDPIRIRRHLALPSGSWDCAIGGCTLALSQDRNPVSNRVSIAFAPEWAPWPTVDRFIDRAVTGVLGRAPTTAGRARVRAGLQDRSITGVRALVEAAAGSRLDADVGGVVRMYRAFFGRPVETGGLSYWVGRLRHGTTALQMGRAFGGTPEFRTRYGGLSSAAAVSLTYRTVLGREPSSDELGYWRGRLEAGMTAADLVYSFARTPEHRSRTNRAVWSTIVLWRLTFVAPTAGQLAGGPDRAAADALATARP